MIDRVSKPEAHNHYQDNEIDILKNIVEKERKVKVVHIPIQEPVAVKRKAGRPRGSKNKKK